MDVLSNSNVRILSISGIVSESTQETAHLEKNETKICINGCIDFIPKRYIFTFVGLLATTLAWIFNTNLNFAVVYMVNRSNQTTTSVKSSEECLSNILNSSIERTNVTENLGEFYWSPTTEGFALSSIYYGTLVGYVPGGRLAEIYGGKRIIFIAILLCSILTCLSPPATRLSVYVFIACRFLLGIFRAAVMPALFFLFAHWIPQMERSLTSSVIFAGYGLGAFIAFLAGGALCASDFLGGWPSIFYVFGFAGFFLCFLCYFFLCETPKNHPRITAKELDFISHNLGLTKQKKIEKIPWKSMISSVPLWAACIGFFGQNWINIFIITAQTIYMGTVLHFDSIQNGQLSCMPQIVKVLAACAVGYFLDRATKKNCISTTSQRKGVTVLNSAFCLAGLTGVMYSGCDPILNTVFFTIAGSANDFMHFGVALNALDIAPNLSGTVVAIIYALGTISSLIIPSFIVYLTREERSMAQWRYIFYWTIGVVVVTTAIFVLFGSTEPQPWGTEEKRKSVDEQSNDTRI